jgi:hypothetical protein
VYFTQPQTQGVCRAFVVLKQTDGPNGGKAYVLISPKDKEGFVRDLASAAPRLQRVTIEALRLKAEQPT